MVTKEISYISSNNVQNNLGGSLDGNFISQRGNQSIPRSSLEGKEGINDEKIKSDKIKEATPSHGNEPKQ